MDQSIPKRIIQTDKSVDLPLLSKAAVKNIKILNPEYEYLFFDNNDVVKFILKYYPQYKNDFDSFPIPIQRYDFFRYLAVYHYGGFYFDVDVILADGLNDLLKYECIFPFEQLSISNYLRRRYNMDWEIGNYAFGAMAGHPFIEAIIKNCIKALHEPNWVKPMIKSIPWMFRERYKVLYTTGPGLVSRTLAENNDIFNRIKILFPENVCDKKLWYRFGEYGIHLMDGRWMKKKGIIKRKIYSLWYEAKVKKIIKESQKIGKLRSSEMLG